MQITQAYREILPCNCKFSMLGSKEPLTNKFTAEEIKMLWWLTDHAK